MNDEQCNVLVDALRKLTDTIQEGSERISDSIDSQYCSDNQGIERRLEKLIDAIDDAAERL